MVARLPRRSLRVAWVGPYDIAQIAHRIPQALSQPFHPATWIRNAAAGLAARDDIELHLLTHHKCFERDYEFEENGIRFHLLHAPFPRIPRPLALYQLDRWKYYRVLDRIRPDVVHGHGTENAFSYVTVTSGHPHVISIQAIITDLVRQYARLSRTMLEHRIVEHIERYTVRRASDVIIKAPFAERFVRRLNASAHIYLVENSVHEAYFAVERDWNPACSRLVFVGTIIQTKGIEELIRAFHVISQSRSDVSLDIVGTGSAGYLQDVVKPLAERGPGHGRIHFHGPQRAEWIADLFKTASLLVLPSYFDTSPNVVAEAMVAGVPVVGTDVGGIPFLIRNGETGRVVPLGDQPGLTAAIRGYLDDPTTARRHAERARVEARARWAPARNIERLIEVYRCVAERAGAKSEGGR